MRAWMVGTLVLAAGCGGNTINSVGDLNTTGGSAANTGGVTDYAEAGSGDSSSGGTGASAASNSGGATDGGSSGGKAGSTGGNSSGGGTTHPPSVCDLEPELEAEYRLVSRYLLDEESGAELVNEVDLPPPDPHLGASPTAHAVQRIDGICGRAIHFGAEGARLDLSPVGDVFSAGIALDVWVRPDILKLEPPELDDKHEPIPYVQHLIGDGNQGLASFQLLLVDGVPRFQVSDNGWRELLSGDAPLRVGEWQHLRVTYDSNAGALEVDGTNVDSVRITLPVEPSYNLIFAGAASDETGFIHSFTGDIDAISILAKR